MSYEQKPNTGSLFRNERKASDTHPDYRGPCLVNGVELEISAWLKVSKSGVKYMSLAFKPPWKKEAKPEKSRQEPDERGGGDFNDDIPFSPPVD